MTDQKRPIEIDDLYKMVKVEDPKVSPDGKWVAFVRVTVDKMDNGYKRTIWLCSTDGGEPRQLTRGGKDSQPRWSPDSKSLAFMSARGDKPQIYVLPLEAPGGEARQLTSMQNGANSPEWSPDGTKIAFLASVNADERAKEDKDEKEEPPKDKLEAKHRKERREEDEKLFHDPYDMWRVPYREGTSFRDGRYEQIYIIDAAEPEPGDEVKPVRLTDVDADHQVAVWSTDGKSIYTGRQFEITDDEPFRKQALYRFNVADKSAKQLTDESHSSFNPLPSPDGKWLACERLPRDKGGTLTESITRLSVMPADGGEIRDLNIELDQNLGTMDWSADGSYLVFNAATNGTMPIYKVKPEGGAVETLAEGLFSSGQFSVAPDGGVAFVASTPTYLPELYWLASGSSEKKQMTVFNQPFLDEVIVQETHEFRFKNPGGTDIQGWYTLPVGYEEGQKYPLALNIHGGPHVMWSPSEGTMWHEWQCHAAHGYVVFYCNPRGGHGYGEAFTKALHSDWGNVAFEDIMAGVDALLEKGFVDKNRMAVTGGSYGGYMTAWVVGHTERFAAAVTQRGVYNLTSFYGTSDVPTLISSEFDAEPWENYELMWKHSPLAYAHKIKTPLLIIHSENDYRVPIEQGEQLFAFVRRSGGTVEMVRYPRDGHELSRSGEPKHRVSRLTKMIEWFDKYCMPEKAKA